MKIDLIQDNASKIKCELGDILIFYDDKTDSYTYELVAFDNKFMLYRLVSLQDFKINEKWNSLEDMELILNNKSGNGYRLFEIVKPGEVELRRAIDNV